MKNKLKSKIANVIKTNKQTTTFSISNTAKLKNNLFFKFQYKTFFPFFNKLFYLSMSKQNSGNSL